MSLSQISSKGLLTERGLCKGGILCSSRCLPENAGMAKLGVILAQSFKSITCFWRAIHMNEAHEILADKGFLGLACVLEYDGHFWLQWKGKV